MHVRYWNNFEEEEVEEKVKEEKEVEENGKQIKCSPHLVDGASERISGRR